MQQNVTNNQITEDKGQKKAFLLRRYLISAGIAVIFFFVIGWLQGLFGQYDPTTDIYDLSAKAWLLHKISDAFVTDGVLFICCGGLVFCSRNGAYDSLSYGVRQALGVMFKRPENMKYKDLYEYKQSRKDVKPDFWYLIFIGLALVLVGVVFLILYKTKNV